MTQYVSCRQKIKLNNNYDDVIPINLDNVDCTTAQNAIILSLFSYDNPKGNTLQGITDLATNLCPSISSSDIETALNDGLKKGIFRKLRPSVIDWTKPIPDTRYTFSELMDNSRNNQNVVKYLIGLSGGTCGNMFPRFFSKYNDPRDRNFYLYKCDVGCGTGSNGVIIF